MNTSVETKFLTTAIRNKIKVTVYMRNGYQIKGRLVSEDDTSILVGVESALDREIPQLLYKTAISTIAPRDGYELFENN